MINMVSCTPVSKRQNRRVWIQMFFLPCFGFWGREGGFTWPLSSADPGPGPDFASDSVVLIQPAVQPNGLPKASSERTGSQILNPFYTSDSEKENNDRKFLKDLLLVCCYLPASCLFTSEHCRFEVANELSRKIWRAVTCCKDPPQDLDPSRSRTEICINNKFLFCLSQVKPILIDYCHYFKCML